MFSVDEFSPTGHEKTSVCRKSHILRCPLIVSSSALFSLHQPGRAEGFHQIVPFFTGSNFYFQIRKGTVSFQAESRIADALIGPAEGFQPVMCLIRLPVGLATVLQIAEEASERKIVQRLIQRQFIILLQKDLM